jgi:hypothetical protein
MHAWQYTGSLQLEQRHVLVPCRQTRLGVLELETCLGERRLVKEKDEATDMFAVRRLAWTAKYRVLAEGIDTLADRA